MYQDQVFFWGLLSGMQLLTCTGLFFQEDLIPSILKHMEGNAPSRSPNDKVLSHFHHRSIALMLCRSVSWLLCEINTRESATYRVLCMKVGAELSPEYTLQIEMKQPIQVLMLCCSHTRHTVKRTQNSTRLNDHWVLHKIYLQVERNLFFLLNWNLSPFLTNTAASTGSEIRFILNILHKF